MYNDGVDVNLSAKISVLTLTSNNYISQTSEKLRGYIASRHLDNPLFHQHLQKNKLAYRYPLIHYLVLDGKAIVFGIKSGADEVSKLFNEIDEIIIGTEKFNILDKQLTIKSHAFTVTDDFKQYRFVTPWLALNEGNFLKFKQANWVTRKQMLARILIGNVLSALKGLDITVEKKIFAKIDYVKPVTCSLKGSILTGFYGRFAINLDLPPLFGIGKSVSRGFGAISEV